MKSTIFALLFALLVGTAFGSLFSGINSDVANENEQPELLEKRAVFHPIRDEDDDDQAYGFDSGESKESDRARKKVYFEQSALQRRLEGNDETNQRERQRQRRLSKKSSKKSKGGYNYYWYAPPVGAAPVRPVSQPVAAPVTVNYNVPITASSPRIAAPQAVTISANNPYTFSSSKGKGSSSSARYSRYYSSSFVSNAPVVGSSSSGYIYVEATATDCQAIGDGGLVEGQRYMSDNTFTFGFNLALDNGSTNIETVIATAQAALQALAAQRIVNCGGYRRRLHQKRAKRHHRKHRYNRGLQTTGLDENIIGNAHFDVTDCVLSDENSNTYTCNANVDVALKGPAEDADVEAEIAAVLNTVDKDLTSEPHMTEIGATSFTTTSDVTHTSTTLPQIGGDPHIVTWKGEHYEYHGQCDMVMLHDKSFADGAGLDLHIRTKLVRFWSYIKNVSIRIGSDILEIVGNPDVKSRDPMYWINYEYLGDLDEIGGFPIKFTASSTAKSIYEIDLSSKYPNSKIIIKIYKEFLRVKMEGGGADVWGNTVGLLGNYHSGETVGRDGVSVFDDYYKFGAEWQVNAADPKIFHSLEAPQFPETCQLPDNPLGDRRRRLGEGRVSEEEAEKACATLKDKNQIKDCVYDILATQDLDMVGAF